MDRERLIELLDLDSPDLAVATCRRGLVDGAEFAVYEETVPAHNLASTYARRARSIAKLGLDSLGFPASVERLSGLPEGTPLRLGHIAVDDPPYSFIVFLDKRATEVFGCVGVTRTEGE
ncbi:hypothetical protein [Phytomonospora endophytica]|uniref:Uncharacterized protein n=1 Tax=Phytomonospora endophytica TaxID=714109 RepID=A0A841G048_9ACTN|nr:hypothetical protein [Phytomonospora endophytica]MBB6037540.1 hypothetical protein [Phytomonospora endophytica]GIG70241.1 hypothetical protein Pen01_65360 [Phytomonospora endophytica]